MDVPLWTPQSLDWEGRGMFVKYDDHKVALDPATARAEAAEAAVDEAAALLVQAAAAIVEGELALATARADALREAAGQIRKSVDHAIFAGADPTDEEIAGAHGFADFVLALIPQEPK